MTSITALVLCLAPLAAENTAPEKLVAAYQEHLTRLKSYDITATSEWQEYRVDKAGGKRSLLGSGQVRCRYRVDRKKCRMDRGVDGVDDHGDDDAFSVQVFDGTRYQILNKSRRLREFTRPEQITWFGHGLYPTPLLAFQFLFQGRMLPFRFLLEEEEKTLWSTLGRGKFTGGSVTVSGVECLVFEVPAPDVRSGIRKLFVAKDPSLSFYPLGHEVWDTKGRLFERLTVDEHLAVPTSAGTIVIPIETTWVVYGFGDGIVTDRVKCWADRESLTVNGTLSDSVFTIPREFALTINDEDNSWNCRGPKSAAAYSMIGKKAPEFTLSTLSGSRVSLSTEKSSVIVLDFWATWCGGCIQAMPGLERVRRWAAETGKSVAFYTVNWEEEREKVADFWSKKNYKLPVLLDTDGAVFRKFKGAGVPLTLLISDGRIRYVHTGGGGMSRKQEEQLKREIDALLSWKKK